jgi:hypothetical protein
LRVPILSKNNAIGLQISLKYNKKKDTLGKKLTFISKVFVGQ